MQSYRGKDVLVVILLGLMFLFSIATVFWGADRCLGLGDEGFYFLSSRYPDEYQNNVTSAFFYTGYLFRMAGYDPTGFRLAGVVLVCLSAWAFWLGLNKFLAEFYPAVKTIKYFRWWALLFIELGALLNYQWFYMTPNYNTLIGVSISISAGSLLWGFAHTTAWQKNIRSIVFAFALGGLGVGLALFTKFPAGLCFVFLYFLVVVLWEGVTRRQKILLAAAVTAGMAVWVGGHFIFIQPLPTWWQTLEEGWGLYQALGAHTPQSKLVDYAKDITFFVYSALKAYWPCYALLGSAGLFYLLKKPHRKPSETTHSLTIFLVMLGAVLLSVKAEISMGERRTGDGSIPFYVVFHFAWILLLLTIWIFDLLHQSRHGKQPARKNITPNMMLVLGLLVALPIAGSVGTSNPLYNVPLCFAATWFGAILLIVVLFTAGERDHDRLRLFGVISIAAFTTSQIIQGYIYDPQLFIKTDLFRQVETTAVGFPEKSLELDAQTHMLVTELSAIAKANGFQPGGDIIALSFIPGLVYAMGGISPGIPTFIAGSKESEDYSHLGLKYADIKRIRKAFILSNVDPVHIKSLLANRGIDFPDGYEKVGTVVSRNKSFSLWKPVNVAQD